MELVELFENESNRVIMQWAEKYFVVAMLTAIQFRTFFFYINTNET
jgi:hypothetical protein